jgi:hypothetical protein
MEKTGKQVIKKRHYRVRMVKKSDPEAWYVDFIWAKSAREAKQIVRERSRKTGEKILKIVAGAMG